MTDTITRPEFRLERVFAAPRQRVWDAWTKPEQIARWFGPKGSEVTVITADIRTGGMLHSRMDTPGGPMCARFDYREVTPISRMVWEHGFADEAGNRTPSPFPMDWPITLLTTVTFADEGETTRVVLTWVPLDSTDAQAEVFGGMFESMEGGWGGSFEALDEYLAG